jgi:HAD superfamily hydrolase (TIGR01484 family)
MEKNHDIKLVALDMDGTLLTSDQEISKQNQAVIAKALANDIQVVLSTGRGIATCYPFSKELHLTSYLVTVNGGEIWTVDKALVKRQLLDTKLIEMIWELGAENDLHCWMIATDDVWYDARPENFYDHQWLKIGFSSPDQAKLDNLVEKLSYHEALELTNSMPTNVEINPAGVNKANALRKVCEQLGITMDNVMACGDSLNDIKMIQQAGIGVAMGNAQEAVKQASYFVTETNDQDGVARAIERFVL